MKDGATNNPREPFDKVQDRFARNKLNLARKWRPQNFDQIVGQTISTRILQNSLFLKKYFPVYLFAGQRGCGKTTTARIFASAINCQNLAAFQAKPTENSIPCLICPSCTAMAATNHPDFIEIDAASHTGVDNVRHIIEASTYIPLSGQKKIYLIDEAHMLSKAAFNAFLKILEEPSDTVLFILATTELHKIPQTVLSRCFQLTFTSIEHSPLKAHLQEICTNEKINIDGDALDIILEETDGSARDAINLLEQVRFSTEKITQDAVLNVLGKVSNTTLIDIFGLILEQNPTQLLTCLRSISFEQLSPQVLWDMLVELCRSLLWVKYGVETLPNSFNKNFDALSTLSDNCSLNRLHAIMQLLWHQEALFLQTNKKKTFLEMVLLQLCQQTNVEDIENLIKLYQEGAYDRTASPAQLALQSPQHPVKAYLHKPEPSKEPEQPRALEQAQPPLDNQKKTPLSPIIEHSNTWQSFTEKVIATSNDLFLNSIVAQAQFISFNNGSISLRLSNNSKFFRDKLEDSKALWHPALITLFPTFTHFNFAESPSASTAATSSSTAFLSEEKLPPRKAIGNVTFENKLSENIDASDKQKWPLANLIISHFPGKIKKVGNSN